MTPQKETKREPRKPCELLKPEEICCPPDIDYLTANYIYWLIMRKVKDPQADEFAEKLLAECKPKTELSHER